jgi:hypothetical protein
MGGWDLAGLHPCMGLSASIDNDEPRVPLHERGHHDEATGSLVRQKHRATKSEMMVAAGQRMRVTELSADTARRNAELLTPRSFDGTQSEML